MKQPLWEISRNKKLASRPIKTNNLIICCGKRTEVNYFEKAAKFIKGHKESEGIEFFIVSNPVDPLNMAKNASKIKNDFETKHFKKIHHVWVVFDKDDFEEDNFNNAVAKLKCKKDNTQYHPLWSNQCIELWFLLHFSRMSSALDRNQYSIKLSETLEEKYQKNDPAIFSKLMSKGNFHNALANARSLLNASVTSSKNDPATTIHEFFDFHDRFLGIFSKDT